MNSATYAGLESAEWYAERIAAGEWWWYGSLGFSLLWTPETYLTTAGTLSTAGSLAGWVAETGPEISIFTNQNIFRIISRKGRWGYRIDPAHHGKPWGHGKFWRW